MHTIKTVTEWIETYCGTGCVRTSKSVETVMNNSDQETSLNLKNINTRI
jgi:hypothetical protein